MTSSTTTCTQIVNDGKAVCGHFVSAEVTLVSPTETVVERVCRYCADWLMGLGAGHLHPTRVELSA